MEYLTDIHQSYIELEKEMVKRTEQLLKVNEQLSKEIEERKKAEEKYKLLITYANDAIFIVQDFVIKFANPKTCEKLGYDTEELEKIPFESHIHPDDRSIVIERYLLKLKGKAVPNSYTFRIINKLSKEMWVEINSVVITWEEKPATLCFVRDITSQKQMEASMQKRQKMEAIGTLAGGIAHDFNNILSAIIGYTELINMDMPESSRAKKNLNEIYRAGNRAKDLVRQILTFSKHSDYKFVPVQMKFIVKEVLKMLRSVLPTTIEIKQHADVPGTILADPIQIHQVLMNLCTNAYHAMKDKGGVLEISLKEINLDVSLINYFQDISHGNYIELIVSDTGCGIPHEIQDKIFDPYFTTKEQGEGTGLGLAVVNGIVKNHKGTIYFKSEPQKGSSFHVLIPLINKKISSTIKTEINASPRGNETILFVDDELTICSMAKDFLEQLGYSVIIETNSAKALENFQSIPEQFDLVITDMTMPHLTGEALAQEIFKIRKNIPIILCTGFSRYINENRALEIGIKHFVMKPVSMRDLSKIIREVLDNSK